MTRPVLLGGRSGLRTRHAAAWYLMVWVPVGICIAVVLRESTDSFSSEQTSGPLRHLFEWLFGSVSLARWDVVHYAMRKTGHFLGYGFTGLAFLRACLLTWLAPLRLRGIWLWRRVGVGMALCCTAMLATADEIHQTYIPSRTGLISDALLDTAGAATLILLSATFWLRKTSYIAPDRAQDTNRMARVDRAG